MQCRALILTVSLLLRLFLGSPGVVYCQHEKPGDVYFVCKEWVAESEDITCECNVTFPGSPKAIVDWKLSPNDTDIDPTLNIKSVQRGDTRLTNFTCEMTWSTPSGDNIARKITYSPKVTYGPTDKDTFVTGKTEIVWGSVKNIALKCKSTSAVPEPRVKWAGVACFEGKSTPECTFRPDLAKAVNNGNRIQVNCTLINPHYPNINGSATHNINVSWDGSATVLYLRVENVENEFSSNKTGRRLNLVCKVFGDPRPDTLDVYLIAGQESSAETGGTLQNPQKTFNQSQYGVVKQYSVLSPGTCDTVDTYRCSTKNTGGKDSKHITIKSDCRSEAGFIEAFDIFAIVVVAALSAGVLVAIIAKVISAQRQLEQDRERESMEEEAREEYEAHVQRIMRDVQARRQAAAAEQAQEVRVGFEEASEVEHVRPSVSYMEADLPMQPEVMPPEVMPPREEDADELREMPQIEHRWEGTLPPDTSL